MRITPRAFECKPKTLDGILVLKKMSEKNLHWSNVLTFMMHLAVCHIINVKGGRMLRKPTKKIQKGEDFQQSNIEIIEELKIELKPLDVPTS